MRHAGEITICDPGSDKPILEAATLRCVHCGAHWQVRPGSGKIRGFCMRCNGPVCSEKCAECIPTEQQLQNMEKGRALDFRPVMVPVKLYLPGR